METVSTDPDINEAIETCLKNIRTPDRQQFRTSNELINEAYLHQKRLGFNNMTLGFVCPKLGDTQQKHLETMEQRNKGKTWLEVLIKKL